MMMRIGCEEERDRSSCYCLQQERPQLVPSAVTAVPVFLPLP